MSDLFRRLGFRPTPAVVPAPPPVSAPAVVSAKSGDYEAQSVRIAIVPNTGEVVRTPVYSTAKRWRGVDVFVKLPTLNGGAVAATDIISARIYAVNQGTRSEVARGTINGHTYADFNAQALKLTAYRGNAERFDVELVQFFSGGVTADGPVELSIVASDQCTDDVDPMLGAAPLMTAGAGVAALAAITASNGIDGLPNDFWELVAVQVVTSAVGRWMHIHDLTTAGPFAGALPAFSFPASGNVPFVLPAGLARAARFRTGLTAIGSSTPSPTTVLGGGDTFAQMWFR